MSTMAQDYRHNQVMTASPMELVLILYDACIRALQDAEEAFAVDAPESVERISRSLLRAQNVITELMVSLDMEKGGEVAGNLYRLYDFMIDQLMEANVKKQVEPVRAVREMMSELQGSWKEIAEKNPGGVPGGGEGASRAGTHGNIAVSG